MHKFRTTVYKLINSVNPIVFIYFFLVFFRVGTDVIYTLSCVWDFKQEMLITTIKDGVLEVRLTLSVFHCNV